MLVEGSTLEEITSMLAEQTGIIPEQIRVTVSKHNSQKLHVHGEIKGDTRVVTYRGPETVLMLLKRLGGISKSAATTDIEIVRPQIAHGKVPEIFQVDLREVLLEGKTEKDIPLQPFDQIYIRESKRSCFEKCLPRWLRPFYVKLCGLDEFEPLPFMPRLPFRQRREAQRNQDLNR